MERYWINQPSTLQEHHKLHGTRVLGAPDDFFGPEFYRVYFLEGPVISMLIHERTLSKGWPEQ